MIFLRRYLASTYRCGIRKELYRAECPDFPNVAGMGESREAALEALARLAEPLADPDTCEDQSMPPPAGLDAMVHLLCIEVDHG